MRPSWRVAVFFLSAAIVALPSSQPSSVFIRSAVANAGVIEVTGFGFGNKAQAAPLKWDDFETGGAVGEPLTGYQQLTDPPPVYTSSKAYSGTRSGFFNFPTGKSSSTSYAAFTGLRDTELYMSYRVFIHRLAGDVSRNIKLARFASFGGQYNYPGYGSPQVGTTVMYTNNIHYIFPGDPNSNEYYDTIWNPPVYEGRWLRIEMHVKLGTPDVANGKFDVRVDGVRAARPGVNYDAYTTLRPTATNPFMDHVLLGFYVAHDPGGAYAMYYDDVYVDRTAARVELCNVPNWTDTAGRVCAPQPPQSWSDGRVVATYAPAGLGGSQYAYVITSSGNVNQTGFAVVAQAMPPQRPTNVRVDRH